MIVVPSAVTGVAALPSALHPRASQSSAQLSGLWNGVWPPLTATLKDANAARARNSFGTANIVRDKSRIQIDARPPFYPPSVQGSRDSDSEVDTNKNGLYKIRA
jgi:hypothetical protein